MKIGIKNRLGALEARAEAICEREQDPLSKSLAEFEDFLAEVEDPTATAAEVGLSDEPPHDVANHEINLEGRTFTHGKIP